MSFDWQTEENKYSEQPEQWLPEPGLRPRRHRLWILLPLALMVAAIIVAGRQVNERVVAVTDAVKEDVLSSHSLARRAAAQKGGQRRQSDYGAAMVTSGCPAPTSSPGLTAAP